MVNECFNKSDALIDARPQRMEMRFARMEYNRILLRYPVPRPRIRTQKWVHTICSQRFHLTLTLTLTQHPSITLSPKIDYSSSRVSSSEE